MKKTIKLLGILLVLCFVVTFALSLSACDNKGIKNLIYIIGDGMGPNHIANTKLFMEKQSLPFEQHYVGDVTTRSANNAVTDSAASATALATGTKTNNSSIGVDPNGEILQNIMELSKEQGKKTGIVTTDNLDGATPAGFSAHTNNRNNTNDIIDCQLNGTIDLLIGQYSSAYWIARKSFIESGYSYIERFEDLQKITSKKRIIGNITNVDSPYDPELTDAVSLKSLVEFALDYLSKSNKGFTLMVEGAYIDKHSHDNDLEKMMYALMDLNDTVTYVLEWASKRDDTAVIFTADHETGALQKAENKQSLSTGLYGSGSHSATNVPLYLYNLTTDKSTLDNVEVYQLAKSVVLGQLAGQEE